MRDYAYEDLEQEAAREQEEAERYEAQCAEDDLESAAIAEIGRLGQFLAPETVERSKAAQNAIDELLRIAQKRAIERKEGDGDGG